LECGSSCPAKLKAKPDAAAFVTIPMNVQKAQASVSALAESKIRPGYAGHELAPSKGSPFCDIGFFKFCNKS
jgi:hypothetical protein